jgi:eukaryotic-like serine/threonine-protein kinase
MRIFQEKGRFLGVGLIVAMLCLLVFVGCGPNTSISSSGPTPTSRQKCFAGKGTVPGPVSFHPTPGQSGLYAAGGAGIYRFSTTGGRLTPVWVYRMNDCLVLTPTIVSHLPGPSFELPRITSGVTVADNLVFFAAYEKTGSWVDLYALHADSGSLAWKARVTDVSQIVGLLVANGLIYTEIGASTDGSPVDIIRAFNVSDGSLRWTFRYQTDFRNGTEGLDDVGNGMVYLTTSQSLDALNAETGKQVWSASIVGDQSFSGVNFFDGEIYATSSSGCFNCEVQPNASIVYAFNATTGKLLWESDRVAGYLTYPAEAQGIVYAGSQDGHLYALRAKDGTQLWRDYTGGELHIQPQVIDGLVCVGTALFLDSTADPNTTPTHLFGFDAATGRQRWSYTFAPNEYDGYGSIVPGNNLLYISPTNSLIDTLQASDGKLVQSYNIAISGNFLSLTFAP